MAAWFYCAFILSFEYRRLLSEIWYATKMFWVLNCIAECLVVGFLNETYFQNSLMITAAVCNVSINVFFIVLIITTEKRAENN